MENLRRLVVDSEKVSQKAGVAALRAAHEQSPVLTALVLTHERAQRWRELWLDDLGGTAWGDLDASARACFVMSENSRREDMLDELLDGEDAASVCGMLARAGTPWAHDVLDELLDRKGSREDAAVVAAMADPEGLDAWLFDGDEKRDGRALITVLRASALYAEDVDTETLREVLAALGQALDDGESAQAAYDRCEALVALTDSKSYARDVLGGTFEVKWLRNSTCVADFLAAHGETSWLETLAILEIAQAAGAFDFASMLAVASSGCLEPSHDIRQITQDDLLALSAAIRQNKTWEPDAIRAGFEFAIAMADEDLTGLIGEVALHERILWRDGASPGVIGLPLAANDSAALDIEAARTMFADALKDERPDDEVIAATVRTLCDLRSLHEREVDEITSLVEDAEEQVAQLCEHPNAAINLAARRLITQVRPLDPFGAPAPASSRDAVIAGLDVDGSAQLLAQIGARDTVAGLWACRQLCELPLDDALGWLGHAWLEGTASRAAYTRAMIEELLDSDRFI